MVGNEVHLMHPSGARVVLIGTRHVSSLDGDLAASAVARYRPRTVALEVDEERFHQLYFRLAHLLQHETATLMTITAGLDVDDDATAAGNPASSSQQHCSQSSSPSGSLLQRLLPDALLWRHHHRQFQLMRDEGVPLLLGSLCGADMLAAALAAAAVQDTAQGLSSAAAPGTAGVRPVQIVLADQPQDVTMQRFRALTDALGQLKQLMGHLMQPDAEASSISSLLSARPASHSEGEHSRDFHEDNAICNCGDSSCSDSSSKVGNGSSSCSSSNKNNRQSSSGGMSSSSGRGRCGCPSHSSSESGTPSDQSNNASESTPSSIWHQSVVSVLAAAVQLAAIRLAHLFLQWWGMALTSRSQWYGLNLHPVFWLADNQQMQQDLEAAGVLGVKAAAAATLRLLECAAQTSKNGEYSGLPDAEDVAAVRRCVQSMECRGYARNSAENRDSGVGAAGSYLLGGARCLSSNEGSISGNHPPVRPWWITWQDYIPSLQHINNTHAAAYEQAVMSERNRLLVEEVWQHAEDTPTDTSVSSGKHAEYNNSVTSNSSNILWGDAMPANSALPRDAVTVVGVVGVNHLSGMELEWSRKEAVWISQQSRVRPVLPSFTCSNCAGDHSSTACDGSAVASVVPNINLNHVKDCNIAANVQNTRYPDQFFGYSHAGLVAVDLLADTLELCVVGAMGLGYWWGLKRHVTHTATPCSTVNSSHGRSHIHVLLQRSKHVGLMLLPVAAALMPLQWDASRFQEASHFLIRVAMTNDDMMGGGCYGASASTLRTLAKPLSKPSL